TQHADAGVILLIETPQAVAEIESIAALPDLLGLLVGPFDLSVSMGFEGDYLHADVITAIERVIAAARSRKLPMIVPVFSPAAVDAVSKRLKQTVIVENRPGAGAIVGAQYVANAQPDGYTFLVGAAGIVTNSFLVKNMPYQDSQLTPVGMIAVAPSVIVVNPS